MKVVALKSFFGSGVSAKRGKTLDVDDKLAKAWIKAGVAVEPKNFTDEKPAEATTSTAVEPPVLDDEVLDDEDDATGEVVDNIENTESQTDGDKDPETDETEKKDDATVAPANTKDNKKGNK